MFYETDIDKAKIGNDFSCSKKTTYIRKRKLAIVFNSISGQITYIFNVLVISELKTDYF